MGIFEIRVETPYIVFEKSLVISVDEKIFHELRNLIETFIKEAKIIIKEYK